MTADSDLRRHVDAAYAQRYDVWEATATRIKAWLKEQQRGLLKDKDISRLDVDGHRIKDPARTLAKLAEKVAAEPDITVTSAEDVEDQIRDIVGVKVLCKSPRDQKMMFDSLRDPEQLGSFVLIEEKNYVDRPKPSGYRACHVTLRIPGDHGEPVFAEIQVKTRLQDAWGELTHEDMYKPGAAMKPSELHGEFARAMANMLATVDEMADTLAVELSALTNPEPEPDLIAAVVERAAIDVRVRATGPKYALAVDSAGRQGLIPAFAVRELSGEKGTIKVSDFVAVDDRLRATVEEDSKGLYYIPIALAGDTGESQAG
ncbi:GTP pyrophosphokinase [Brevibacterium casei]|uniref:GTP pyrophosphokinase n=1 Tax=Brevibacterium casei TaxID=33889 RepID=UPI00223BC7A4|nr:RelA/SpoT domain-containing protein [Brevibacterium casei]MCT1549240.1 RelA/SpoT domain-containing protein [Brevibacterium casei]MCT1560759.1 RelA/SpoT domain-containing protein [Brevibacterium casei]MCT2207718.1 RelA/SpoT domain-containing protein [Brevibacterium casei]